MKENKTLGITIRFWTNDLRVQNKKDVLACWDSGIVCMEANKGKEIKAQVEPFNKFSEIDRAIEKLLKRQKIFMVKSNNNGRFK